MTLNKICYYYVQHLNSLMNTQNIDKQIKKLEDWMINYSNLVSELNKIFEEKNVSEYLRYTILDDLRDRTVDRIWSFRK